MNARYGTGARGWKLAMDVFLESYHLRPTHKETIYPMFFDNLGLVDRVGPHLRNVFPKRSIQSLAGEPDDVLGTALRKHANILFHVFPNTLVLVQPDHAAVVSAWPLGIARSRLIRGSGRGRTTKSSSGHSSTRSRIFTARSRSA